MNGQSQPARKPSQQSDRMSMVSGRTGGTGVFQESGQRMMVMTRKQANSQTSGEGDDLLYYNSQRAGAATGKQFDPDQML
jgi:hypothetical protein